MTARVTLYRSCWSFSCFQDDDGNNTAAAANIT